MRETVRMFTQTRHFNPRLISDLKSARARSLSGHQTVSCVVPCLVLGKNR